MPYGRGQTAGLPYSRLSTVWSRPDVKLSSPTPSEHGLRSAVSPIVNERMRAYYERPAREYDDWWLSTGLFARRDRPRWTAEVEQLVQVINALGPANALDVACGTGFLTRHLHGNVVAIDQSETMATIAAERLPGTQVLQADPIPLPFRAGAFDRVFTSHFYGHLHRRGARRRAGRRRRASPRRVVRRRGGTVGRCASSSPLGRSPEFRQ